MGLAVLKKPVRTRTELNLTISSTDPENRSEVARTYVTMDETPNADDPNFSAPGTGGATGAGLKIKAFTGVQRFSRNTTPTPTEFVIDGDGTYQLNYIVSCVPPCADATTGHTGVTVDFTV